MQTVTKVLVVDDDYAIVGHLTSALSANGYLPIVATTGEEALHLAYSWQPDLILLELSSPGIDGVEILQKLRLWFYNPIIIVTSITTEAQKVKLLDLGANDYITKPFGMLELLARIRAALRDSVKKDQKVLPTGYQVGGLAIDFQKHLVTLDGVSVHLTRIEFKMVELLARHPGRVLTYEYIMEQIWGPYLSENNKILRVNMTNIRRKLKQNPASPQYIRTEVGIGYSMALEEWEG